MLGSIIKKTLRVPLTGFCEGVGKNLKLAMQLDSALLKSGFKLSGDLLTYVSRLPSSVIMVTSQEIIKATKELIGDHVKHNVYFKEFPRNIPDTEEFWCECIVDALISPEIAYKISMQLSCGFVNLLDLPKYGKYLHSYEDMTKVHEALIPSLGDRITVLNLGKSFQEECVNLYNLLACSNVPLNADDLGLLEGLAGICLNEKQPEKISIRENKAIINKVRIENDKDILIDTPTDILRLACALSDGDVSLQENTRFKSFKRSIRRALLLALDVVVCKNPDKIADMTTYREQWKRLYERLHPSEYQGGLTYAKIAMDELKGISYGGRIEKAFKEKSLRVAMDLLSQKPGYLFRSFDRIIRGVSSQSEEECLLKCVEEKIGKVSGRVILSLYEHLINRTNVYLHKIQDQCPKRIFVNKKGTSWVRDEDRESLSFRKLQPYLNLFDCEIKRRLPACENLILDSSGLDDITIPLSEKNKESGFNVMPRGSRVGIDNDILRFFMYWKEKERTTDYDLSCSILDSEFQSIGHISYTDIKNRYGCSSGDITSAPKGASEFIEINLQSTPAQARYIVPSVNVYGGEGFHEVEESFFGFMTRSIGQEGLPYDPTTVKYKSELRGKNRVATPLAFVKVEDDSWYAKWMNLYLSGDPRYNRVEENKATSSLVTKSIIQREYLAMDYLTSMLTDKAKNSIDYEGVSLKDISNRSGVVYIGVNVPENMPQNVKTYSLSNLSELIPE